MMELPHTKDHLFGKTLSQLESIVKKWGMPAYTAGQIAGWLYKHDVCDIDQMSNISRANREKLSQFYELGITEPVEVQTSVDGTKKYLFGPIKETCVETAYIPDGQRHTLCVSSQLGCRMGCVFCMTGKQGFHGQLSAGQILNQIRSIPEKPLLTNIVYMGMGEPLDNLDSIMQSLEILTAEYGFGMSPRRITVSTIGIIPAMKVFLEQSRCNLAVSLHSPFEEERRKLMPIEHAHKFSEVLNTIKNFSLEKQRRVSIEYIVFRDLNHSASHLRELARVLNGIRCRVNLIRYHAIPGIPLNSPSDDILEHFKNGLENKGIITTIRRSRGQDIHAACGLLSTKRYIETSR